MKSAGSSSLSVRYENVPGMYRQLGEPFYQLISIGVGGKTLYPGYSGAYRSLLTMDPDTLGTIQYMSAESTCRLVAGEEHGTFRS